MKGVIKSKDTPITTKNHFKLVYEDNDDDCDVVFQSLTLSIHYPISNIASSTLLPNITVQLNIKVTGEVLLSEYSLHGV